MRKIFLYLLILLSVLISGCSTSTPQPPTPQVVSVYSSPATQPWLTNLYDCAAKSSVTIRLSDSESAFDIRLQIGASSVSSFAYQIDTEEILIVTQRQSPVQNLTMDQARDLFQGLGDPSVQVWVYASDADVQQVFDQFVMNGRSVTSSAKVAVSPQEMSDTLNNEPNTVVVVLADSGERYLDTIFDDRWVAEQIGVATSGLAPSALTHL